MRSLLALVLAAALLAGCASDDPEPAVADNTDETEQEPQAEEPPTEEEDADGDAAPETDDAQSDAPEDVAPDDDGAGEEAPAADDASADAVEVEIGDFFFDDDQLVIEVGETVTWTHQGEVTHNVTSQDGSFASENLSPGDTFTHTFETAGAFEYRCTLHGQMTAEIEVT